MSISNAMIQSNDGGKPYMKEKNESKEKNKTNKSIRGGGPPGTIEGLTSKVKFKFHF